MPSRHRIAVGLAIGLCALGAARPAVAQTAEDVAAAEAAFNEGKRLMAAGDFGAACPKLEASQKLDPGIGTLLNLGDCYEHQGKVASAWGAFTAAASMAKRDQDTAALAEANRRSGALEPRLPRLVIAPALRSDGLVVKRDGTPMDPALLDSPIPVDPGSHVLVASAPGKKPFSATIDIPQGPGTTRVVIPELAAEPVPVPPAPVIAAPTTPPPVAPSQPVAPPGPALVHRPVALIAGVAGVAAVALGVGTYFGIRAYNQRQDANAGGACNGVDCSDAGFVAREDARTSARMADVAFGVGAAAGVAAILIYALSGRAPADQAAGISATALQDGGGLVVRGRF